MRRKARKMDPILLDEMSPDDEWIVETEEPCLPTDPSWLEGTQDDISPLDVTAINTIQYANDEEDLQHANKRQRTDIST